jgi:YidC/Oxa1 family membrane protein insertase
VETRALLAFLLSVAILVGYQILFVPHVTGPVPETAARQDQPTAGNSNQPRAEAAPAPDASPSDEPSELEAEEIAWVETDLYRVAFTSTGGRIKHFELKQHRLTDDPSSPPLDMILSPSLLPLGVYWRRSADGQAASDARVVYAISSDALLISGGATARVTMTGSAADGSRITKSLVLHGDSYVIDLDVQADAAALGVAWSRQIPAEQGKRFSGVEGPVGYVDDVLHAHAIKTLSAPVTHQGVTDWAGYGDHYFLAAYYPSEKRALRFVGASGDDVGEMILWDDDAGGRVSYQLFVGPKQIRLLDSLGHKLSEAMYLGRFAFVARPLLELMIFLHGYTGNYGWTIVLITLGIRVVFYPVNKRQIQSMKAMQRIQPELKRIQEKYKDDREQLNKEMIEVYRRHKVNPLGGCLPMVLQLPVFLGLYNALMQAIELRHAPFIGWIHDLSQPDRLGNLAIPFVSPPGIPVLTLFMGVSMLVQQRMTPSSADPMQQRMMMVLPAVFTVMFINFPSGLVLYWLANNVLSIAQQQVMTRGKV